MKKTLIIWLCSCLWLVTLPALSQTTWKPTKAAITFSIRNAGLNVDGSFGGFTGTLLFDPARPETGKLSGTIETASLSTGLGLRDSHLRKAEYFDVAAFPRISLTSVSIENKGGNNFSGVFDLTLKGTTRRVTVPFTFTQQGKTGQFSGSFTINRLDYKVGKSNLFLSEKATVSLAVQVQPAESN
jgi:polyisoprenoid-binding protein YceI